MKKILFTALLLCSLMLFTTPCAIYASENTLSEGYTATRATQFENSEDTFTTDTQNESIFPNSYADEGETCISSQNIAESEANDKYISSTTKAENNAQSESESSTEAEENQAKAWSVMISEVIGEYVGEIFCALTFIGSLITAFLYKKGLLPTLGEGINKICSIVVSSGEKATGLQMESAELLDAFVEKAMPILEKSQALSEYAEQMRKESLLLKDGLERDKAERKALLKLIEGQIELLYGVFMSASLPEYQKELLGAQYNRLKLMIGETHEGAVANADEN